MAVSTMIKQASYRGRKLSRRFRRVIRTAPGRLRKQRKRLRRVMRRASRGREPWSYRWTLRFVPIRSDVAEVLNRRRLLGRGVEVGVKEGDFSELLLAHWRGAELVSIDPWLASPQDQYVDIANVSQDAHDELYAQTQQRLSAFGSRSAVWRMTSLEGSQYVPSRSLDFVYIDARHDYESVKEDLAAWFGKVRPGGIIAGHDYFDAVLPTGVFGVRSAVDEFFGARGLRVRTTRVGSTWMVAVPRRALRPGRRSPPASVLRRR